MGRNSFASAMLGARGLAAKQLSLQAHERLVRWRYDAVLKNLVKTGLLAANHIVKDYLSKRCCFLKVLVAAGRCQRLLCSALLVCVCSALPVPW